MTGKARARILATILAVGAGTAVAAQGTGNGVSVTPGHGGPGTQFVVRFTAPDASGHVNGLNRGYIVNASGPSGATRCVNTASLTPQRVKAHARVRVTLNPHALNGKWCTGRWSGTVEEYESPICPPGKLCPAFVAILRRLGRFHFNVQPTRPSGDTAAPTFSGLTSALACTPGPQRPGQTTPFTLRWKAATDNVTPQDKLVYDVFESSRPGGEDYARPSWTSRPGVTSFKTPGLPSHGLFYFVVRARDQAGNEDRNHVERRGVDPCL